MKTIILAAMLIAALTGGCVGAAKPNENTTSDVPPVFLKSEAIQDPGKSFATSYAALDYGGAAEGYFNVMYLNIDERAIMQLTKDGTSYSYVLHPSRGWEAFPLVLGSGEYSVDIYKNVSEEKYVLVLSHSFIAEIADEYRPFLRPSCYVSYEDNAVFTPLAESLGQTSELSTVTAIYNYVVEEISYDYEKAQNLESGYLPDIDETIQSKKGICFDYAALMTALLRSRNIPTKLVVGYAGSEYHAWISVYITDVGWVEGIIYFDGRSFSIVDPTYDSTSGRTREALKRHITDSDNYNPLYYY